MNSEQLEELCWAAGEISRNTGSALLNRIKPVLMEKSRDFQVNAVVYYIPSFSHVYYGSVDTKEQTLAGTSIDSLSKCAPLPAHILSVLHQPHHFLVNSLCMRITTLAIITIET